MIGVSQTSLMVGGFRSHHDIKTINIARVDVIEEKLKTASNLYPLSNLAIISLRMAIQIKNKNGHTDKAWCSSYRE